MKTREKLLYERVDALIKILHEFDYLNKELKNDIESNTELGNAKELVDAVKRNPLINISDTQIKNNGDDAVTVSLSHDEYKREDVELNVGGSKFNISPSAEGEYSEKITTTKNAGTTISIYADSSIYGKGNIVEIEVIEA